MKKLVVVFFVFALFFIAGCQEYLNQDAVGYGGDNTPDAEYCLRNWMYDNRCSGTFSDMEYSNAEFMDAQGPATGWERQLAAEQARLDNLAQQGKLDYNPGKDGQLTREDIREINVLLGLSADATAADREQWYAEWAAEEDKKFAAAIARGEAEQAKAEREEFRQDLLLKSQLAAGENDPKVIAQALAAAEKLRALEAEERLIKSNPALEYLKNNGKPIGEIYKKGYGDDRDTVRVSAVDIGKMSYIVYDSKTGSVVGVDGKLYYYNPDFKSLTIIGLTEKTRIDPDTGKKIVVVMRLGVVDIADMKIDMARIKGFMEGERLGNAMRFQAGENIYVVRVLQGTETLQPGALAIQRGGDSFILGQGRGALDGLFMMNDVSSRGIFTRVIPDLESVLVSGGKVEKYVPALADSLGQIPSKPDTSRKEPSFEELFGE